MRNDSFPPVLATNVPVQLPAHEQLLHQLLHKVEEVRSLVKNYIMKTF